MGARHRQSMATRPASRRSFATTAVQVWAILACVWLIPDAVIAGDDAWSQFQLNQEGMTAASTELASAYLGDSVSLDGDYALAGSTGTNTDQGSAYVFFKSSNAWSQQAILTASDGVAGDFFGFVVALSGAYAVVGTPYVDPGGNADAGAVYVFIRGGDFGTTWVQVANLVGNAAGDLFGFSVAVSADANYIVIGAPGVEVNTVQDVGSTYILVKTSMSTWAQQQVLTPPGSVSTDWYFGWAVAITSGEAGTFVLPGAAKGDSAENTDMGVAYVYVVEDTSWSLQATLTASDPGAYDQFGYSVAAQDPYYLVGAPYYDGAATDLNTNSGAAYMVYRSGTTYTQVQKLEGANSGSDFGLAVALSGYAVVGTPKYDAVGMPDVGSVYVFRNTATSSWSQVAELASNSPGENALFGESVATSGGVVLVGSRYHDTHGITDSGAAYVFTVQDKTMSTGAEVGIILGSVGGTAVLVVGAVVLGLYLR